MTAMLDFVRDPANATFGGSGGMRVAGSILLYTSENNNLHTPEEEKYPSIRGDHTPYIR